MRGPTWRLPGQVDSFRIADDAEWAANGLVAPTTLASGVDPQGRPRRGGHPQGPPQDARKIIRRRHRAALAVGLKWPLPTSPAPSRPVARAVVRCSRQSRRSLEVRRAFFSRTRRTYPHGAPHDDRASPSLAGSRAPRWPYIRLPGSLSYCFNSATISAATARAFSIAPGSKLMAPTRACPPPP
jgi:hypothetical protein